MKTFSDEYKEQFKKTLKDFCNDPTIQIKYSEKKYDLFYPMIGFSFASKPSLLFYGRCLNGWGNGHFRPINPNYTRTLNRSINWSYSKNKDELMDWIKTDTTLKPKPFWQVIKKIVLATHSLEDESKWGAYCAFSNILKITPSKNQNEWGHGNIKSLTPTEAKIQAANDNCWNLYSMEIKELVPDYVIQITDINSCFEDYPKYLPGEKIRIKNSRIIKAAYKFKNTKIIITCRPERINQFSFVSEVLNQLN